MNLEISEKAKKYLTKKSAKTVTVGLIIAGCCVEIGEPAISLGQPKDDVAKYDFFEVDGYGVYFFKNPSLVDGNVTLDTSKFLGIESLSIKGVKYM